MPHPRPTRSKPDRQTAGTRNCEEDDSDDVFGIDIGGSSLLNVETGKEETSIQRVRGGKHRAHSTAIKAPHRRIGPRDNLKDIFEGMRAQRRPLSTRPETPKSDITSDMTKLESAFRHYTKCVISSTRARKALVSFGERISAELNHDDAKEAGRFKDDVFGRLVIRKSIEKLIAEAENLDRSWLLGREVNAMERKVRSELVLDLVEWYKGLGQWDSGFGLEAGGYASGGGS
jgi:hypothetical protein